nr:immunoglobulin heavy chain junction region [Macaca mulatta]MOV49216.1 immunoglobulin heavy chain junction region [Macaca mulatta]MOV49439.1 immunoglobulin heavy chain junction region [Macaca mulatta]MOV49941.1 immunoglobulin heavy chain junction region [Macaca mulatta]MOV49968.1 immunoglobulin heavy chain junction region [Macaca mulatta]
CVRHNEDDYGYYYTGIEYFEFW